MSFFSAIAGAFKKAIPAVIKGIKSGGGKALKGLKGLGGKIVKGVKRVGQKLGLVKKKPKEFVQGDPVSLKEGLVDVAGGKMLYRGGKPVSGKVIRGGVDAPKPRGLGSDTFKYIDNLTDPESILL